MNKPICTIYEPSKIYGKITICNLLYDCSDLTIQIKSNNFIYAKLTFKDVIGFRVLDERDLCEFWADYNESNGWLYEVHKGGWIELETIRKSFTTPLFFQNNLKEYFIVDDTCVSIICLKEPIIEKL